MIVKLSPKYLLAFFCLTILCGTSHEFVHHFTGAIICRCFGYKTFNSFELCKGCQELHPSYYWAILAGPLFTYGLMWLGLYQLSQSPSGNKQLGFALIFANFPINRIIFALMHKNDEQYAATLLFGHSTVAYWLTNMLIWICTFPPLMNAYRSIRNRHRMLWFLGFFVLPFVFVIAIAGILLENILLIKLGFLSHTIFGIPYLILLVEFVCLFGYLKFKKYLQPGKLILKLGSIRHAQ